MVYKDECSFCFSSATAEAGINLCLNCFEGSCNSKWTGSNQTHTELHAAKFGHVVYLNIRKHVERETPAHEDITKIAIGAPGGGGMEIEKITYTYSLICFSCQKKVDHVPKEYEGLVRSIEQHQSAFEKTQLVSWELEQNACPHSRSLVQQPTPIPQNNTNSDQSHSRDISKCVECDLSANLWLCLTCGNVGCGRKNFDGTGGNSHGIGHYNSTRHPISVKTGTISPNEAPSCYCYICDDDVKVPHINDCLINLGLNPTIMRKTEKTINEMSLEYNLNLKLSEAFEKEGQYEKIISKNRPWGLTNIGNSCYMNSVLQCLAATNEFSQYFSINSAKVREHILSECKLKPSECLVCQTSKVVSLFENAADFDESIDIRPYIFRHLIGKDHLEFRTQRQQDAAEYLTHLFQVFKNTEKILGVNFSSLFRYKSVTKLTCSSGCQSYNVRENKGLILDLNLTEELTKAVQQSSDENGVTATLKNLLEGGIEQHDEVLDCSVCKGKRLFKSKVFLSHFPKYLIVRIQNFVQDNFQVKKAHIDLRFDPDSIDLISLDSRDAFDHGGMKLESGSGSDDVSPALLDELQSMGFSINRSKRALMETNNNLEGAINLLFSVEGDPEFDKPIESLKKVKTNPKTDNEELIQNVWSLVNDFGVSHHYVTKVCNLYADQGIDFIVNYFLENPEDNLPEPEPKVEEPQAQEFAEDNGDRVYKAIGSVVHLGKSVHVGHYVAYSRRAVEGQEDWIYFNDHQVYFARLPSLNRSYLLFLQKI
jgi:ubiquitin carboxyl-terminal hydrolase 5/13